MTNDGISRPGLTNDVPLLRHNYSSFFLLWKSFALAHMSKSFAPLGDTKKRHGMVPLLAVVTHT